MTLSRKGHLYVLIVSAAGLLVLAQSLGDLLSTPVSSEWLVLAGLTLLSGSFTIKVPTLPARISVSETFVFTSVLLFGPSAGTITVALDTLVVALGAKRRSREPLRVIFNLSAASLSIWLSGHLFFALGDLGPLVNESVHLPELVGPLVIMTLVYFLSNSWLVAFALASERQEAAASIWQRHFLWLSVNFFGGASVAALLVSYTRTIDFTALGIIVPLLVISYLTFKTSLGRIEDANRHVEQVNQLYLSTIETLATAIDAKDQVTHGHIRRVQRFALGLASELGLKDENQRRAIEAAALLHDMGKLVVPEHILNKPGRLTHGEFEKMKLHASVGAEILSSIQFPYPVVPIVRHHHENWDGTGYPDGLKATEIPIGARILAVVDCFDALTSDRPYRRRLSDAEALSILVERRGRMYDPLVVDTFLAVKDKLLGALLEAADAASDAGSSSPSRRGENIVSDTSPIIISVWNHDGLRDACHNLLQDIADATDSQCAALFLKDHTKDELVSVAFYKDGALLREPLRVPLGSRVSGWVAANGRTVLNADAELDLAGSLLSGLARKCLAVPIGGDAVTGVLSCYRSDHRGFSSGDVEYVERRARAVASTALGDASRIPPEPLPATTVH